MLDTNIASYAIKGNFPGVRKQLLAVPMAQVCISAVTEAELLYGIAQNPTLRTSVPLSMNSSCEWIYCPGIPKLRDNMHCFAAPWSEEENR